MAGGITRRKPIGTAVGHRKASPLAVVGPIDAIPDPPRGLLQVSIRRWSAFWRSPVAGAIDLRSDLPRLERWIQDVDEYERAGKALRSNRLVRGSQGQPVLNPLAAYLHQLDTRIRATETDFGMTPMARIRLGIAVGEAARTLSELNAEAENDPEAFDIRSVFAANPLADNGSEAT